MEGFAVEKGVLVNCKDICSSLIIPNNVSIIGDFVFENRIDISNVRFPDNLRKIGRGAFKGCINITSIEIPLGVVSIGDEAFKDCTNLKSIEFLGGNLITIGESAFSGCSMLKDIEMPERSVEIINNHTFSGCTCLEYIRFPDSTKEISSNAFYGCLNLKKIGILDTYTDRRFIQEIGGDPALIDIIERSKPEPQGYAAEYIRLFCSSNSFSEKLQKLLLIYDRYNSAVDLAETVNTIASDYTNYFQAIINKSKMKNSNHDLTSLYNEAFPLVERKNIVLQTDTIQRYLRRSWIPVNETEGKPPSNQQKYIVIQLGFVFKFSAEQVNALLKAAGLSELSGRIFSEAIEIFCLNSGINYVEYLELVVEMKKMYVNKHTPNKIITISDLRNSVAKETDAKNPNTVNHLTVVLTEEIKNIRSKDRLYMFLSENRISFFEFRETARRYLCKYLLEKIDKEQVKFARGERLEGDLKIYPITDDYEISKKFEHIWNLFDEFYLNYTRISDQEQLEDQVRTPTMLRDFINGDREITRSFFILFLIFLGFVNLTSLDHCLLYSGFDTIDKYRSVRGQAIGYRSSGFDDYVYHLLTDCPDMKTKREFIGGISEQLLEAGITPPIYLYTRGEL